MSGEPEVILFQRRANERMLDEIRAKDALEFGLGDTLDVKASILLAAIALLATQTAYFLDKQVSGLPHLLLVGAALLLVLATVAALLELWPRDYMAPVPESGGLNRIEELSQFYSEFEDADADFILAELTKDEIEWAIDRIGRNRKANNFKSRFLNLSFYLTLVAMGLNIATLLTRLF